MLSVQFSVLVHCHVIKNIEIGFTKVSKSISPLLGFRLPLNKIFFLGFGKVRLAFEVQKQKEKRNCKKMWGWHAKKYANKVEIV